MNSDSWGPLIVSLCGALVAAVAFTVLGTTGWREFARAFPDRPFQTQLTYQGFRGYVGQAPFWSGGPVLVAVGEAGLRLVPIFPVRRLLPVVVVPWSAITTFQSVRPLFAKNFIRLGVAGAMFPLCISGFLERQGGVMSRLQEYWEAHGPCGSSTRKPPE
jgi:hypothetical protein